MRQRKFFYCPSCGEIGEVSRCHRCSSRKNSVEPVQSLYTYEHYIQESYSRFQTPFRWKEVFIVDELFKHPYFNAEQYNAVKSHHLYLCPVCAKHHNTFSSPAEITCTVCGQYNELYESKHCLDYYHIKSMVLFGDFKHNRDIIIDEELSHNPLFNRAEADKITIENMYAPEFQYHAPSKQSTNIPKCPTCNSINIKKISASSKVFGAAMFGLFSRTAHSQFCCNNCGYKW